LSSETRGRLEFNEQPPHPGGRGGLSNEMDKVFVVSCGVKKAFFLPPQLELLQHFLGY